MYEQTAGKTRCALAGGLAAGGARQAVVALRLLPWGAPPHDRDRLDRGKPGASYVNGIWLAVASLRMKPETSNCRQHNLHLLTVYSSNTMALSSQASLAAMAPADPARQMAPFWEPPPSSSDSEASRSA